MKKRSFVLVSLLAACELQPAPKQAPPPVPATPAQATPPAGSAAPAAPVPRPIRTPPPAVQPTAECEQAGIKVAALLIDDAEPSQKPAMERERADNVRKTEQACTTTGWTPPAIACIAQSKTIQDAHTCLAKFPPPGAGSAAAGSGSAGAPVVHPRKPSRSPA